MHAEKSLLQTAIELLPATPLEGLAGDDLRIDLINHCQALEAWAAPESNIILSLEGLAFLSQSRLGIEAIIQFELQKSRRKQQSFPWRIVSHYHSMCRTPYPELEGNINQIFINLGQHLIQAYQAEFEKDERYCYMLQKIINHLALRIYENPLSLEVLAFFDTLFLNETFLDTLKNLWQFPLLPYIENIENFSFYYGMKDNFDLIFMKHHLACKMMLDLIDVALILKRNDVLTQTTTIHFTQFLLNSQTSASEAHESVMKELPRLARIDYLSNVEKGGRLFAQILELLYETTKQKKKDVISPFLSHFSQFEVKQFEKFFSSKAEFNQIVHLQKISLTLRQYIVQGMVQNSNWDSDFFDFALPYVLQVFAESLNSHLAANILHRLMRLTSTEIRNINKDKIICAALNEKMFVSLLKMLKIQPQYRQDILRFLVQLTETKYLEHKQFIAANAVNILGEAIKAEHQNQALTRRSFIYLRNATTFQGITEYIKLFAFLSGCEEGAAAILKREPENQVQKNGEKSPDYHIPLGILSICFFYYKADHIQEKELLNEEESVRLESFFTNLGVYSFNAFLAQPTFLEEKKHLEVLAYITSYLNLKESLQQKAVDWIKALFDQSDFIPFLLTQCVFDSINHAVVEKHSDTEELYVRPVKPIYKLEVQSESRARLEKHNFVKLLLMNLFNLAATHVKKMDTLFCKNAAQFAQNLLESTDFRLESTLYNRFPVQKSDDSDIGFTLLNKLFGAIVRAGNYNLAEFFLASFEKYKDTFTDEQKIELLFTLMELYSEKTRNKNYQILFLKYIQNFQPNAVLRKMIIAEEEKYNLFYYDKHKENFEHKILGYHFELILKAGNYLFLGYERQDFPQDLFEQLQNIYNSASKDEKDSVKELKIVQFLQQSPGYATSFLDKCKKDKEKDYPIALEQNRN